MKRPGICFLFFLFGCTTLLYGRTGVVKLTNGLTYEGDIDEKDPVSVAVTARGITTRVDRSKVASVTYGDSASDLAAKLTKLDAKDVAGRLTIAKQALASQQYIVARDATEQVLQIDPNNAEAVQLQNTIQGQMRMDRNKEKQTADAKPDAATRPATTQSADNPANPKVLRPAEINLIRQAELRSDDSSIRIRFERNLLKRYVDFIGRDYGPAFYAKNPLQQALEILDDPKAPRAMRQDVVIMNDPAPLLQYRRVVQPFVVQNCATAMCHGGNAKETKFQLIVPADSEPATYTNFYILDKYVRPATTVSTDTVFGHGDQRMIDRQSPNLSLLIQYALPGSMSEQDHPDVTNYRPPLRNMNDPRAKQLQEWIGQALRPEDPDYGFEFNTPATQSSVVRPAPASTQPAPATQPATGKPVGARPAGR